MLQETSKVWMDGRFVDWQNASSYSAVRGERPACRHWLTPVR